MFSFSRVSRRAFGPLGLFGLAASCFAYSSALATAASRAAWRFATLAPPSRRFSSASIFSSSLTRSSSLAFSPWASAKAARANACASAASSSSRASLSIFSRSASFIARPLALRTILSPVIDANAGLSRAISAAARSSWAALPMFSVSSIPNVVRSDVRPWVYSSTAMATPNAVLRPSLAFAGILRYSSIAASSPCSSMTSDAYFCQPSTVCGLYSTSPISNRFAASVRANCRFWVLTSPTVRPVASAISASVATPWATSLSPAA